MDRGYIPLWRKFLDNDLWTERRKFSRAECWIDLLLNVRWAKDPETVVIKNKVLQCSYGESLKSLDTWARRWGHSKTNVKRVLDLFTKLSMICYKSETVTVRITVCNFEKYDIKRNALGTQAERKRNASGTQAEPEQEGQEGQEGQKRKPPIIPLPDFLDPELWKAWVQQRKAIKKPMTQKAEQLSLNKLTKWNEEGYNINAIIENAIERGWQGLYIPKDMVPSGNGGIPTESQYFGKAGNAAMNAIRQSQSYQDRTRKDDEPTT